MPLGGNDREWYFDDRECMEAWIRYWSKESGITHVPGDIVELESCPKTLYHIKGRPTHGGIATEL